MAEVESTDNGTLAKKIDDATSPLEQKIINQIEYYFGDANLNRDKFLLDQISKNDDGWVPISILLTFKRLASLTEDSEVIAKSLLKSDEGLVEVSDDHQNMRRHPERPIPEQNEERRKEISSRTAYAKGFPLDSSASDIIDHFQGIGKIANVSIRKYLDKATKTYKFKGSVFVTFVTKEQCEEFIKKDKVEYAGKDLIRKWQEKYLEEKREERQNNRKKKGENKKPENECKIDLPKGAVIYFEGVKSEETTREHIKSAFEELGADVVYIDFSRGDKTGYVRFNEENSAGDVIAKCPDNKIKIKQGDFELSLKLIEGEEETEYLIKVVDSMKSKRQQQKGRFRGRQGGGGGGGHGNNHHRKRKAADNGDEKSAKQGKSEEKSETKVVAKDSDE